MSESQAKSELLRYLQAGRDAVLWKLEGLSEYDVRRPLVPTGSNLLGLVKHLGIVEIGYFGQVFGRPFGEGFDFDPHAEEEPNFDMWATAEESREYIIDLYKRAWHHSDETIKALSLDAVGVVPWWRIDREATLHRILVHEIAETHRHAGHADLMRELIDGEAGLQLGNSNLHTTDGQWWAEYRNQLEDVALRFKES